LYFAYFRRSPSYALSKANMAASIAGRATGPYSLTKQKKKPSAEAAANPLSFEVHLLKTPTEREQRFSSHPFKFAVSENLGQTLLELPPAQLKPFLVRLFIARFAIEDPFADLPFLKYLLSDDVLPSMFWAVLPPPQQKKKATQLVMHLQIDQLRDFLLRQNGSARHLRISIEGGVSFDALLTCCRLSTWCAGGRSGGGSCYSFWQRGEGRQ
jgi:hypothetical protein